MSDKSMESTNTSENTLPVISPFDVLTKREMEVLELIAQGFTNAIIAKTLYISEHTVNDFTKKIYRKLNVHNRQAAAQLLHHYSNDKSSQEHK